MKTKFKTTLVLVAALVSTQICFSQLIDKSFNKSKKNENMKNKEIIHFLYDSILNGKQFIKLSEVVSTEYSNAAGGKGIEGFHKTLFELSNAFPDAQWMIETIIGEENKVVVKQKFTGTQTNLFQNIKATNKSVSVDGIATYELQNGKIIRSQVQTDRLAFLQQLGVLPIDVSTISSKSEFPNAVYFIDKFSVPKTFIEDFKKQMNYNREFIKTLSGFVGGEAFEQYDNEGNLFILTIAVWESQDKMNEAKASVESEFKRINFNPAEFYQRLHVKMERGQYKNYKE